MSNTKDPYEGFGRWERLWIHNKGVVFVIVCELFNAGMVSMTRALETDHHGRKGMETFQV